jgi:hypothetical protein
MIRPGIDSLGRPAVCADNHYDAVLTPPKHRGSYGLLTVNLPKDLHANAVSRCTYLARERALTVRTIRSQAEMPILLPSYHAQTVVTT